MQYPYPFCCKEIESFEQLKEISNHISLHCPDCKKKLDLRQVGQLIEIRNDLFDETIVKPGKIIIQSLLFIILFLFLLVLLFMLFEFLTKIDLREYISDPLFFTIVIILIAVYNGWLEKSRREDKVILKCINDKLDDINKKVFHKDLE